MVTWAGEREVIAHHEAVRTAFGLSCKSLALPAISTGVFGYPIERATSVAVGSVRQSLESFPFELVRFVLFLEHDLSAYRRALNAAI